MLDERGEIARGVEVRLETRPGFVSLGLGRLGMDLPAQSWLGTTDHEGRATFTGLTPSENLFASLAQEEVFYRQVFRPIVLSPGEHARTTLHLRETRITGVARDRTGSPVPELPIWLVRADAQAEPGANHTFAESDRANGFATTADRTGRFFFADVLPGTWWIGPAPPGDPPRHVFAPTAIAVEMRPEDVSREIVVTVEGER